MSGRDQFKWTDDNFAQAKAWFLVDGMSATEIGKRYGISRNAVIGKMCRAGFTRAAAAEPGAPGKRRVLPGNAASKVTQGLAGGMRAKTGPAVYAPLPKERPHDGSLVPLEALEPHHCRWPVGDPSSPSFGFCGAPKAFEGKPYCAAHAKAASGGIPTRAPSPMPRQRDSRAGNSFNFRRSA